jgi:[1-hydroxy-2-(trimethylamino)ethyl]phosphonate dioxygenase
MRAHAAIVEQIEHLYATRAQGTYFGEAITQLEHGLQCAHFAEAAGAGEALVIAALLHDIGHLVVDVPTDLADWTEDARHEETGADWLSAHFDAAVTEPVRLHVAAKRYLCATDAAYYGRLSEASVHTLRLQGGPMSAAEVVAFDANPYAKDAVLLRLCDEQGKVQGFTAPALSTYRARLNALMR